jgi:hypothetical protein
MKGKAFALAGAAGAFVISGMASAAYVGMGGPDDLNMGLTAELVDPVAEGWDLLGYDAGALDTYRVYANFDENGGAITAIGAADLVFELGSRDGAFVNSAFGSDFAPNPLFTGAFPDLLWDTFATIGETVATGAGGVPLTTASPGFNDGPGGAQAFGMVGNFTMLNSGWFVAGFPDVGNAVNGQVLVAQLTVADGVGVFGTNWRVSGIDETGASFDIISNFDSQFIPAPGAIALLGLAGLVSGRRRRR